MKKTLHYHFKSKYIGKRKTKIVLLLLEDKHYTCFKTTHFIKILRKLVISLKQLIVLKIAFTSKFNLITNKIYWISFH